MSEIIGVSEDGEPIRADHLLAVSNRDLAMILAGLRLYQMSMERYGYVPSRIEAVATDDGVHRAMSHDEIDQLCEDLNQ